MGRSNRSAVLLTAVAILLLAAGCLGAGPNTPTEDPSPGTQAGEPPSLNGSERTDTRSPGIDPVLADLVHAADRARYAAEHDLEYRNGSVRVVVELKPNRSLPAGYDVDVEHTVSSADGPVVQAFVDVDRLAELAREPWVRTIRRPLAPVTASE